MSSDGTVSRTEGEGDTAARGEVSGLRFGEFLEQRVFAPLAMVDRSFVVPEAGLV
jgi:hypothetical protein